jgi:hypothetical protein
VQARFFAQHVDARPFSAITALLSRQPASWGDSDEEDSDVDMETYSVLDGADESQEREDNEELVERIKAGKSGIMA